jgi:hypothetical protein
MLCVDLVSRHPEDYIKIHNFLSPSAPNILGNRLNITPKCHIYGREKEG